MEKNIEKELQALRKDYEVFKEEMEVQHKLNEKVFRAMRKQPAGAVNREIGYRMMLDITTVPVIMMICIIIDCSAYWCRCGLRPTCLPLYG